MKDLSKTQRRMCDGMSICSDSISTNMPRSVCGILHKERLADESATLIEQTCAHSRAVCAQPQSTLRNTDAIDSTISIWFHAIPITKSGRNIAIPISQSWPSPIKPCNNCFNTLRIESRSGREGQESVGDEDEDTGGPMFKIHNMNDRVCLMMAGF